MTCLSIGGLSLYSTVSVSATHAEVVGCHEHLSTADFAPADDHITEPNGLSLSTSRTAGDRMQFLLRWEELFQFSCLLIYCRLSRERTNLDKGAVVEKGG